MMLSKPIIVCRETGVDKLVKENGIGEVIGYNAKEFVIVLEKYKDEYYKRFVGSKGRRLYDESFSWNVMEERLINSVITLIK
jgi:glycosyltransferase involved in cell wall biosynthesis